MFKSLTFWLLSLLLITAAAGINEISGKIANSPACREEVLKICSNSELPNDLAVLECLQNRRTNEKNDDSDINPECHNVSIYFFLTILNISCA